MPSKMVAQESSSGRIYANSYYTCDNMDFVGPFTRPVIFTLSLIFIFVLFIPPVFSNYLFLQVLLDVHPCYGSAQARGPENGPPLFPLIRHCKNERIKNNLVAMDEYALLKDTIYPFRSYK
jgi:hypothetical protein